MSGNDDEMGFDSFGVAFIHLCMNNVDWFGLACVVNTEDFNISPLKSISCSRTSIRTFNQLLQSHYSLLITAKSTDYLLL